MTIARTVIAAFFLLFAAYVVTMNWGCVIVSSRNKRKGIDRHHSTVPLFSLFLAGIALLIWPFGRKLWIMIIPLLDIANWSLLLFPIVLLREWKSKRVTK